MKKCAIIHVCDGNAEIVENKNRLLIERFTHSEEVIEQYLSQGYEVKHIIPDYSPAVQGEGNPTFFKGGITIYFEKESEQ